MAKRLVLKFDNEKVGSIFQQIFSASLPSFTSHLNEAANRSGEPCDLHVEQTKQNEFMFRHKSGNKGPVFVQSDDEIGVKLLDWDQVPLRTKYVVQAQTQQGIMFMLMLKTGDVDQRLEYLDAQSLADLADSWEAYDEKVVEQKKAALEAEKKAQEEEKKGEVDPDLVDENGDAVMEVNREEDSTTPDENPVGDEDSAG